MDSLYSYSTNWTLTITPFSVIHCDAAQFLDLSSHVYYEKCVPLETIITWTLYFSHYNTELFPCLIEMGFFWSFWILIKSNKAQIFQKINDSIDFEWADLCRINGFRCERLGDRWWWKFGPGYVYLGWCYVRFLWYDDVKSYTRKWQYLILTSCTIDETDQTKLKFCMTSQFNQGESRPNHTLRLTPSCPLAYSISFFIHPFPYF